MRGVVVKGIGGFYYVKTSNEIVETKGRGILKKDGATILVGDDVEIELLEEGKGVINKVMPRKNFFIRPPISNVDYFVVTFAVEEPKPNYTVIDKFLIMAEMNGIEVLICVNKEDLATEKKKEEIRQIYSSSYPLIFVSTVTENGLKSLEKQIKGKRVAFAGPSGVGKSSIVNKLLPHANMEIGEVSHKTKRGKHTTRHVEIFTNDDNTMIFDTPGFTSFEILEAEYDELEEYYPEIANVKGSCKYDNCKHINEPDCVVKSKVEVGDIPKQRYESYLANMDEIKKKKRY